MKRTLAGAVLAVVALGATPAYAARCDAKVCLADAISVVATDICEDGEDCQRLCAPFDDPIVCAP